MKNFVLVLAFLASRSFVFAQSVIVTDSLLPGTVTIHKDPRIDMLGKKMGDYNAAVISNNKRSAHGYRLMVLSTSDRALAMSTRSALLQQYPDQGVYMSFQSPYIKLKFGNFLEKDDAERVRKQLLSQKLVPGNIYLVPETIEVKPDKNAPDEEQ